MIKEDMNIIIEIIEIMMIINIIIKNIVEVIAKIDTKIIQKKIEIENINIEIGNIKEDQDQIQEKVVPYPEIKKKKKKN